MKVAIVFATDGSSREDAVLAPFRATGFIDGLKIDRIDPVMISLLPEKGASAAASPAPQASAGSGLACRPGDLRERMAGLRPDAIQTFGPEHRLAAVWRLAAEMGVPLVHCVSCWRKTLEDGEGRGIGLPAVPSFASLRARRASGLVDAVIGTSRAAPGRLLADGYFARARFSVVVPPPVERAVAAAAVAGGGPGQPRATPVFGIYDPHAAADLIAFMSRALQLTGRPQAFDVRLASNAPPTPPTASAAAPAREGNGGGAAAPLSFVAAGTLDAFLASIDVLAVPAYDDSIAAALIAALRAGKSVIVPDRGGAAELIEYGRHGFMFSAGSAYHFATALNIVSQSWKQRPILLADGGPAIAKTHPVAVAHSFATVYASLGPSSQKVPATQSAPMASPTPHPGPAQGEAASAEGQLRCGIVALARSDRRMMEATLQSIGRLADGAEAVVLAVPKLRGHLFDDAPSHSSRPIRVVAADNADALPLADGFRALAPKVDVIIFVPEGVVLGPSYLASVHEAARRWPDLVGEIGVIPRIVEDEGAAPTVAEGMEQDIRPATDALRGLRPRTLFANLMWVRVEACGSLKFMAFPQSAEYLAFSSLLDQLRSRGRTRVTACNTAVQVRPGPERRSGYEAGRELYGALSRIGEWRDRSDAAFAARSSYLDPRTEKIRLFVEQITRYLAQPAARAHIGSFIRGMWAARREAAASRHRIRDDIRNLG
jgi:Glycosyl transferases group 1